MKLRVCIPLHVLVLSFGILVGQAHGQVGQSDAAQASPSTAQPSTGANAPASWAGKVLVSFNALPPAGSYELVGPISVFKRWFGGTGVAMRLLGERARELGANAVVETRVWLAPAFPAQVAPHGNGIAIRVLDPEVLERLVDEASSWE